MTQNGYSNSFFHGNSDLNTHLSISTLSMNETSVPDEMSPELEGSSALDHALLESLFYNEMMMLNSGPTTSSSFLSNHFIDTTTTSTTHLKPNHAEPSVAPCDLNTLAEKDLLRDFGVSSSPVRSTIPSHYPPTHPPTAGSSAEVDPWAAAAAVAPPQPPSHPQHAYIAPAIPVHPPVPAPNHLSVYQAPNPAPTYPSFASMKTSAVAQKWPPPSIDISTPNVPEDRTKQLVDQFATLASRLGIDLPKHVLQSLTAAAAKNDPEITSSKPSPTPGYTPTQDDAVPVADLLQHTELSASSVPALAIDMEDSTEAGPTILQELKKTAEEAIASVTKKRGAVDSDGTDSVGGSAKDGSSKHLKRKKKPRLSDCESRLAELRAENEVLKRHLENVSNKAQRFDQEKEAAGKRIHALLEENAGPEEMMQAVQEFTEMYSDYGRNRQQELSFHLEQLQRLVNPTNFTKMGLWTLGQNSVSPKHNPIAGILQKELDITPQQGRKILEQSEKIRVLCDNLKECLALLAKLKSLCEQKTKIFQDRMDKCREILTTNQVVKLIKWIDDHTQLLETVCPGWGTEHIHSSTKH